MEDTCYTEGCNKPSMYYCGCSIPNPQYCSNHLIEHTTDKNRSHKVINKFVNASLLTEYFNRALVENREFKNSLIQRAKETIQQIINSINIVIDKIRNLDNELNDVIDHVQNEKIINDSYKNAKYMKMFAESPVSVLIHALKRRKKAMESCEFKQLLGIKLKEIPENSIYLIKPGTKQLVKIDSQGKTKTFQVNLDENATDFPGFCNLPEEKLLYIPHMQQFGYIIDKETNVATKIATTQSKSTVGNCLCFNNFVYSFGFWYSNFSEKFSLNDKSWSLIAEIPAPTGATQCEIMNKKALIAGYLNSSVFLYDFFEDQYKIAYADMAIGYKFTFKKNKRFYVFFGAQLIESSENNPFEYQVINTNTKVDLHYPVSCNMKKDNYGYFLTHQNNLYQFDFNTKHIILVRKITY